MKLTIAISTVQNRISTISKLLLPIKENLFYVISVQNIDDQFEIPSFLSTRPDIHVSICKEKGLSNNRNNSLKHIKTELCLISDDDCTYTEKYIDDIIELHKKHSKVDILTGKIFTGSGEKCYKNYPSVETKINQRNFNIISSIEISFKTENVRNKQINFDARFGLGSSIYPRGGEENIFISDCLKNKLQVMFTPSYFVNHPYESSGKTTGFPESFQVFLGAFTKRIYGKKGLFISLYFFKKYLKYLPGFSKKIAYFKNFLLGFKTI